MNILFPKIQILSPLTPAVSNRSNSSTLSFCGGEDIFLPSKRFENCRSVEKILRSVRKVTPNEYKKFSAEEIKDFFYYNLDDTLRTAGDENLAIARPLKSFLDTKYGKDKYVFVSIGTSPAPVGRVFEFSGVESKYLPVSDLMYANGYQEIARSDGVDSYNKFLKEQGISGKNISRSRKTFVFYDFTSTGKSLNLIRDLMVHHFKLPEDKLDFRSLNEDIYYCCNKPENPICIAEEDRINLHFANAYVSKYLSKSEAEYFGGICHLPYLNLSNIDKCKLYSDDISKIYNLYVMHKLAEIGQLQYNKKNRRAL